MLDELVNAIETVKERISAHREVLVNNETQTRLSLIDPILCALGWDTSDPSLVRHEYRMKEKRADYALLGDNGVPLFVVEAKAYGKFLENNLLQMSTYARALGIRYPLITDGDVWEIYDNLQMVPIDEARALRVKLTDLPASQSALKLLLLWRPNSVTGQPVEALEPVIQPNTPTPESTPPPSLLPQEGWVPLSEFKGEKGKPPTAVRFDDGSEKQLRTWNDMFVGVAEWLHRIGKLTEADIPVHRSHKGGTQLINSSPKHSNGTRFGSFHEIAKGMYLDLGHGAKWTPGHISNMVKQVNANANTIFLRMPQD